MSHNLQRVPGFKIVGPFKEKRLILGGSNLHPHETEGAIEEREIGLPPLMSGIKIRKAEKSLALRVVAHAAEKASVLLQNAIAFGIDDTKPAPAAAAERKARVCADQPARVQLEKGRTACRNKAFSGASDEQSAAPHHPSEGILRFERIRNRARLRRPIIPERTDSLGRVSGNHHCRLPYGLRRLLRHKSAVKILQKPDISVPVIFPKGITGFLRA